MHPEHDFTRDIDDHRAHERGFLKGHYDWLRKNHDRPIYMLFDYPEIPNCSVYPLGDVSEQFFSNLRVGKKGLQYFSSSFAYMVALALHEDFDRIEVYGFEMSADDEYAPQKAGAEFWLGVLTGMGKELYLPPDSQLLWGPLYGYQGRGAANVA